MTYRLPADYPERDPDVLVLLGEPALGQHALGQALPQDTTAHQNAGTAHGLPAG